MTHYCPSHDPALQAMLVCRTCGETTFSADADWVDYPLLLVSWRAACAHIRDRVELVDVTQLEPETVFCLAPTRMGTRCRLRRRPGLDGCHHHARRPIG